MENKQIWMTVLIAFFVGVLASLVTSWTMGSAQYSPPTSNVVDINANRCQADGVCEMTIGKVTDSLKMMDVSISATEERDLKINADSLIALNNFEASEVNTQLIKIFGNDPQIVLGDITISTPESRLLKINANEIETYGQITATKLTLTSAGGNSSAYACFNAYGLIFRSATPCV